MGGLAQPGPGGRLLRYVRGHPRRPGHRGRHLHPGVPGLGQAQPSGALPAPDPALLRHHRRRHRHPHRDQHQPGSQLPVRTADGRDRARLLRARLDRHPRHPRRAPVPGWNVPKRFTERSRRPTRSLSRSCCTPVSARPSAARSRHTSKTRRRRKAASSSPPRPSRPSRPGWT